MRYVWKVCPHKFSRSGATVIMCGWKSIKHNILSKIAGLPNSSLHEKKHSKQVEEFNFNQLMFINPFGSSFWNYTLRSFHITIAMLITLSEPHHSYSFNMKSIHSIHKSHKFVEFRLQWNCGINLQIQSINFTMMAVFLW